MLTPPIFTQHSFTHIKNGIEARRTTWTYSFDYEIVKVKEGEIVEGNQQKEREIKKEEGKIQWEKEKERQRKRQKTRI